VVVVYFDNIGAKKICPELKAYRTHSVALQKPAPVVIYDYYDNCESRLVVRWKFFVIFLIFQLALLEASTIHQKFLSVTSAMAPKNARMIAKFLRSTSFESVVAE
jgi:A-macroglobulin receptor binding domain